MEQKEILGREGKKHVSKFTFPSKCRTCGNLCLKNSYIDSILHQFSPRGNPGRSYDGSTDLTEALKNHYDPELALKKIKETHEWLKVDKDFDDMELEKMNWKKGYNLTPWTQMPGEIDTRAVNKVILQCATGGRLGISKTGPGDSFRAEVTQLREALNS